MQIVGGIWADKLGGKVVLGFGVVWWSIATVLTPFAARLGLPFLLVVRALMGIGEVSLYMLFPCFFQNLDTADFPNILVMDIERQTNCFMLSYTKHSRFE